MTRIAVCLAACILPMLAAAHDARPNYVQITETAPNFYSISWKVPGTVPGAALPYPTMPDGCVSQRQPAWQQAGGFSTT